MASQRIKILLLELVSSGHEKEIKSNLNICFREKFIPLKRLFCANEKKNKMSL